MNIGFLHSTPAFIVLATVLFVIALLLVFFMPRSLRNPEGGFGDNDVLAIAGFIALFALLGSLRGLGMTRASVTLLIYLSIFAFACHMLFRAFRKGARERKKLAEAGKLAPHAEKEN